VALTRYSTKEEDDREEGKRVSKNTFYLQERLLTARKKDRRSFKVGRRGGKTGIGQFA